MIGALGIAPGSFSTNCSLRGTLPYDCRSGTCTTCIQKCLEGEIDQDMAFAIGDEELEQGLRLICIGSPLSDVVLDA